MRAVSVPRRCMVLVAFSVASVMFATATALAGDVTAGREKASKCKTCHGLDGIGRLPQAPNLAGESTIYLEKQLKAFRDGTRQDQMMSIIAADLSDEDIADLAAWYASLIVSVEIPEP